MWNFALDGCLVFFFVFLKSVWKVPLSLAVRSKNQQEEHFIRKTATHQLQPKRTAHGRNILKRSKQVYFIFVLACQNVLLYSIFTFMTYQLWWTASFVHIPLHDTSFVNTRTIAFKIKNLLERATLKMCDKKKLMPVDKDNSNRNESLASEQHNNKRQQQHEHGTKKCARPAAHTKQRIQQIILAQGFQDTT